MGLLVFSRLASRLYAKHKVKFQIGSMLTGFFLLLFLGGFIMQKIEGPHEVTPKESIEAAKMRVRAKYPTVPVEALDDFIVQLNIAGFDIKPHDTYRWSLGNAFMVCVALVTSIGYGHLNPQTKLGRATVIVYSIFGIPYCLYVFSWAVSLCQKVSDSFRLSLYYRFADHIGIFKVIVLHFCLTMTLVISMGFLFPAYLFTLVEEEWSYFDSLYFVFISSTTIGLGDFVPGKDMNHALVDLYRIGASMYMLISVIMAMFILNQTTEFAEIIIQYKIEGKVPVLVPEEKTCTNKTSSYGSVEIVIPEGNNNEEEKKPLIP